MIGYVPTALHELFKECRNGALLFMEVNKMLEIGEKRNHLTYTGKSYMKKYKRYGLFICDCGKEKFMRMDSVSNGRLKSCGCNHLNTFGINTAIYGKLFCVYNGMLHRCYDSKRHNYENYGGRGINVCNEWRNNFHEFVKWSINNGWSPKLSIERKDVNGNYCPENCTWIPLKLQARNRTTTAYVTYNGQTKCIAEWCEILNIPDARAVYLRHSRGIEDPERLFYVGDLRSR